MWVRRGEEPGEGEGSGLRWARRIDWDSEEWKRQRGLRSEVSFGSGHRRRGETMSSNRDLDSETPRHNGLYPTWTPHPQPSTSVKTITQCGGEGPGSGLVPDYHLSLYSVWPLSNSQQLFALLAPKTLEIPGKGILRQCLDKLLLGSEPNPALLGSGLFPLLGQVTSSYIIETSSHIYCKSGNFINSSKEKLFLKVKQRCNKPFNDPLCCVYRRAGVTLTLFVVIGRMKSFACSSLNACSHVTSVWSQWHYTQCLPSLNHAYITPGCCHWTRMTWDLFITGEQWQPI